ncbi:MAG: DUF6457 domain-containing protein, partial [Corynebacterium variabile]|nr:DUF6457 domain-containing protein [Corynebacterium variabile]
MNSTPAKGSPEEKAAMLAWLDDVADQLGIDHDEERALVGEILQLTSTVAHDRSRPAAPVTAFLIGLAAVRAGTDPTELIAAVRER